MGAIDSAANILLCNQSLGLLGTESIIINTTSANYTYCETFFEDSRDQILAAHKWNFAKKRAYAIQTTDPLFPLSVNAFTKPSDCLKVWRIADDNAAKFEVEGNLILTNEGETPPDWATATDYIVGQVVSNNDITYTCLVAHTSGDEADEPGTGADAATYWTPPIWVTATDYIVGQVVSNDDVTYICIADHTSGDLDDEPGAGAVTATYWTSQDGDYEALKVEYVYQATDIDSYPPYLYQCLVYNLAIKLCSPIKQEPETALTLTAALYGGPKNYGYLGMARSADAQEGGGEVIKTSSWLESRR